MRKISIAILTVFLSLALTVPAHASSYFRKAPGKSYNLSVNSCGSPAKGASITVRNTSNQIVRLKVRVKFRKKNRPVAWEYKTVTSTWLAPGASQRLVARGKKAGSSRGVICTGRVYILKF